MKEEVRIEDNKIKHTEIKTIKIVKNVWIAYCDVLEPLPCEVKMKGISKQDAIDKLNLFFSATNYYATEPLK